MEVDCAHGHCDIQGLADSDAAKTDGGRTYPLFWMRYVDWFFTTPFFLLDLCLLANADNFETFYVMLMNAVCIAAGAIGALKPAMNVPMFILGMATFAAFIEKLVAIGKKNDGKDYTHYNKVM